MQSRYLVTALLIVLLASICAEAEERPGKDVQDVADTNIDLSWEKFDQAPSKELLEFLMEWETPSGEWVGPQEIADIKILESKNEMPEK
jgi:hypothetical protein